MARYKIIIDYNRLHFHFVEMVVGVPLLGWLTALMVVQVMLLQAQVQVQAASILEAMEVSKKSVSTIKMPSTDNPNTNQCVRNGGRFSHDWYVHSTLHALAENCQLPSSGGYIFYVLAHHCDFMCSVDCLCLTDRIADEVVRVQDLHISMGSTARLVNTVWLAWAALHLPGGDYVEAGVWKGGTSVLMLKVLLTFDTCKR
jgi:hypothetical protein